jgi:hypothetical protein
MKLYRLERMQSLPRSIDETFEFFADPRNLKVLTPAFVGFEFLHEPPKVLAAGTLLDYRIRLFGLPVRWQTRIEVFEPPTRFEDIQIRGPYTYWRHVHRFADDARGGTSVRDEVDFAMPLGPLSTLAYHLFVERTLREIFDYRRDKLADLMGRREERR